VLFGYHKAVSMTAVYELKMKYDQGLGQILSSFFLDTFNMISFCLEDRQVVNEHHILYMIYEKVMMPHGKNVLMWCISMYHVAHAFKNVTLKTAKKIVGVAVYWYVYDLDCTDEPEFYSCWTSKIKLSHRNKHLS